MCKPMDSSVSNKSVKRSEAIWINKSVNENQSSKNSYDSGLSAAFSSYGNSFNSIMSRSPFDYKRQSSFSENRSDVSNNESPVGGRRRTMTISSDCFSSSPGSASSTSCSPSSLNQQSPFRRSNSISGGVEPNFGGIIKRSMGQLFNAATVNTSLATATIQKSVPKVKCVSSMHTARRNSNDRNEQITDHMVSYLCESAIR